MNWTRIKKIRGKMGPASRLPGAGLCGCPGNRPTLRRKPPSRLWDYRPIFRSLRPAMRLRSIFSSEIPFVSGTKMRKKIMKSTFNPP